MNVSDAFAKSHIVPDVVPIAPDALVNIRYNSGVAIDTIGTIGRVLTPTQVKDEPHVSFGGDSKSLHTLILTG